MRQGRGKQAQQSSVCHKWVEGEEDERISGVWGLQDGWGRTEEFLCHIASSTIYRQEFGAETD